MTQPVSLFRREALENQRSRGLKAEVLAIDPAATRWGFRLLAAGIVVALVFVIFGRLSEYATGPAIVRVDGSTSLTAAAAGLVSRVEVSPGDKVKKGQVLVRFHASEEMAQYEAASREFDSQLGKLLLRPDDPQMRETMSGLRAQRDVAKTRLEQRTLVAPQDGVVGDVRVREGQVVDPGLRLLDLQEAASSASVVALMPGRYRPLLHPGDKLRFTLDGFHARAYELVVTRVGDQIVGPTEAARYLGRDLADTFPLKGPVVLVHAALTRTSFDVDGEHYDFANGMYGKAEVAARNEPLAYAFVPSLKQWGDWFHGVVSGEKRGE